MGRHKKIDGTIWIKTRLRPDTVKMLHAFAALMGEETWQDIADEIMQIGLMYAYKRRRANLIQFEELPEIHEKLPNVRFKTLKGTEYPPL